VIFYRGYKLCNQPDSQVGIFFNGEKITTASSMQSACNVVDEWLNAK
jgi:hypothetical protein